MKAPQDDDFPSQKAVGRFGSKPKLTAQARQFCEENTGFGEVKVFMLRKFMRYTLANTSEREDQRCERILLLVDLHVEQRADSGIANQWRTIPWERVA